ncbi:MAG TPA: hypothetical protein VLT92_12160 [Burkholderiales bacterium]|nr:hypothetical protein [Burkholderiales bacterium]
MAASETSSDSFQPEDYGVEVLCASWNPVVTAVAEPAGHPGRELPDGLSTAEADSFLKQFYRCQKS